MVFWKTFPLDIYYKSLFPKSNFTPLIYDKTPLESPTGNKAKWMIYSEKDEKVLSEVREFIKSYFGHPPKTPILDIPESELLKKKDHLIFVRDISDNIVGCIRYKYIGKLILYPLNESENQDIYYEDCFCIHPNWRKKGLADYLLTYLHNFFNNNNINFSLFLKEGRSLGFGLIPKPYYSGKYVYTEIQSLCPKKIGVLKQKRRILDITPKMAFRIMDILQEFCPKKEKSLIIRNSDSENQTWKLYQEKDNILLICFQDTFQRINEETPKKIGWITAWFESPQLSPDIKEEVIALSLFSIKNKFDYIWANSIWVIQDSIKKNTQQETVIKWIEDGSFHYYTYQWATDLNIKKNYCITV